RSDLSIQRFSAFDSVSKLEREAEGELEGAGGVAFAGVEIVTVFNPDGANDGSPAQTASDGEKAGLKRVVGDLAGVAQRVGKKDHGPFRCQGLLKFCGAQGVGFGSDNLTVFVAR